MRLLSLELHGFKSFPDKTLLKFAPGVTTVVGPNGSGKSNISDAVRWVLGEISSKSMRGTKMEDVIFSGSDTRKPMNFAEVSITLDNREENGFSRMPIDYDEVTITRRLSRNGGSDYFINRQPARLKDINSLFMNTGIGRDGYSIVSQGKASEIISQKSDERRNVFEEAAGISKYRYQKNEAEKKLEATSLNCERLADILSEKKKTLERLEKDAERAKKYLDIYEKKKEADISLAVYDVHLNTKKLSDAETEYNTVKVSLDNADNKISDTEAERDRLDLLRSKAKEQFFRLNSEIEELTDSRYNQNTGAQVMQGEVKNMTARIEELNGELEKLNTRLAEYINAEKEANDKLSKANDVKNAAEQKRNGLNATLSELDQKRNGLELKIEAILDDKDAANAQIRNDNVRIAELDGTARSDENRRSQISEELKNAEDTITRCNESMQRHKSKMDSYDEQSEKIKATESETANEISALRQKIDGLNASVSSLASDLRDIRTRIDSLKRMEELFEGYPHSVSAIMNAVKTGTLSGICGPLSHIFTVNTRYAVPIETALASTLQNIVCENEDAAKRAIEWLRNNNAGRTTFYPLNTMQVTPLNIDEKTLLSHKGYLGIASDLIEYEPKYDRVIKNLLGRTLVFDNLNNATAMAKACGYRVRIVTLDGQQINAGGSFTGGSKKRDSGLLNRSAEIDRLNADMLKTETLKNTAQEEQSEATRMLAKLITTAEGFATKLKLLNTLYQAESNQYAAFKAQMDTVSETKNRLLEELSGIADSGDRRDEEKKQLDNDIAASEDKLRILDEEYSRLDAERGDVESSISSNSALLQNTQIEIAEYSKDVESAERDLQLKNTSRLECESEIQQKEAFVTKLREGIADKEKSILASSSKVEEMDAELKEKTSERERANSESIEYDGKISALNNDIQELMRMREHLSNDFTKAETKKSSLVSERDRILNYVTEEYSITFSEAEALEYPPVTEENRHEISQQLNELKYKLRGIGSVDPSTIEEFKKAKADYDEMNLNFDDMLKSRESYANVVDQLEQNMRTRFIEVIGDINEAFQRSFSELFGGGRAEVVLTDMDDVLHCGIDINVAPPGKIIKSLSLLSGGEQAFISIALVFALLHVNPSPFCIFDEIEAALDEVNVAMFANYIKKYSNKTQFITITHRRGTMEVGDTLYGVTMAERGISRVLTLNVNEVESKLGVKL